MFIRETRVSPTVAVICGRRVARVGRLPGRDLPEDKDDPASAWFLAGRGAAARDGAKRPRFEPKDDLT